VIDAVVVPPAPPGPLHRNVAGPLVSTVAVSCAEPPAGQFAVVVAPIEQVGGGLFVTPAVAVLVQPFAEFVTVTVKVPEHVTLGFAMLGLAMTHGPDQTKLVPEVVEAERTTDVVVQVNCPPVALAPGGCLS